MRRELLVLTAVHHPDDVRIRRKLIEALRSEWNITYACREPGPSRRTGIEVRLLTGGRVLRNLRALRIILRQEYDVLALHDPETLPAGLLATWFRRKKVVFDVHENIPAQILTKDWLPKWSRRLVSRIAHSLLRLAERSMAMTLAERGYAPLFRGSHPTFENLLPAGSLPRTEGDGVGLVYLGDITEARGIFMLIRAVGRGIPGAELTLIGPCSEGTERRVLDLADECDVAVELAGRLEHNAALGRVAEARLAVSPLLDIPNYRMSMPTKLLEYLAVGVPVVTSDLQGTRATVEGLEGVVLVAAGDVDGWASALRTAMKDDDLAEVARRQAPTIQESYVFPSEAVRTFYRSLLD